MKTPLHRLGPALLLLGPALACGEEPAALRPPASDVEQCQNNLRAMYAGLVAYADEHGGAPEEGGVRFFATLVTSGTWENTAENARRLTCPGPGAATPAGPPETWFADAAAVDGSRSAYAGRDLAAHPLPAFPMGGSEILVACDNEAGMNHEGVVNALFADGSVRTYRLEAERERGTLGPEATVLPVGPGSPHPELAKLSID